MYHNKVNLSLMSTRSKATTAKLSIQIPTANALISHYPLLDNSGDLEIFYTIFSDFFSRTTKTNYLTFSLPDV